MKIWCSGTVRAWSSVTFTRRLRIVTVIERQEGLALIMANAAKSSSQLKVLYAEGNAEVLAAQADSIRAAGHQVETALGRKAVEEVLRSSKYDLVVLGPTLSKNDRHHLPYMVKKANEATRVLVMHTDGERHPAVDANLDTGRGIQDVVAKIATMWPRAEAAKAAAASR